MKLFKDKVSLAVYSLVLAVYTVAAFHYPFFSRAVQNVSGGLNSVLIIGGLALIMLALDFLLYYVLVYVGRFVGKCIVTLSLMANAAMLYFVNTYDVLVTDEMMGNVFHTTYSETAPFIPIVFILYVLLLGVLPGVYVFARKLDYGSWKRFLASVGVSVGLILAGVFGNMKNWPWIDRNSTELGSLIMPWSYVVNTFRYQDAERKKNIPEILLPDGKFADDTPEVFVLVIGESARRDHFSLYGYGKETNPYTSQDSVIVLKATAAATNTLSAVRAIMEPVKATELYEILPNYLYRTGADVIWRTSNWGEPPVHIGEGKYVKIEELRERYPDAEDRHDAILLQGLKEDILSCEKEKLFVVVHTYTNHGPIYSINYPSGFEVFTPVSNTVEMSRENRDMLLNAYDNSIVYTDYLIHSVIEMLRDIPERRSCMIYLSDHGESLGEGGLYMHGIPLSMAPREQVDVPFLVWSSDKDLKVKPLEDVSDYHVYHSVLDFFKVESEAFDKSLSIFE